MSVTISKTTLVQRPYDNGFVFSFIWESSDGRRGTSPQMSVSRIGRAWEDSEIHAEMDRLIAKRARQIEADLNRCPDTGQK